MQAPDAYFTDSERPARREVAAVFCQARTAVLCRPLHALCQPTGAGARLPEGAPSGGSSAESTGNGDESGASPINTFWIQKKKKKAGKKKNKIKNSCSGKVIKR